MRDVRWLRALGCLGFLALLVTVDVFAFYGCYSLVTWLLGLA